MKARRWLTIQHTDEKVTWVPYDEEPNGRLIVDDGRRHFAHEPVPEFWYEAVRDASKEYEQLYLIAAITTEDTTIPQGPLTEPVRNQYKDTYNRVWSVFEALDYRIQNHLSLEYMSGIIEVYIRKSTSLPVFEPVVESSSMDEDQLERLQSSVRVVPDRVIEDIIENSKETRSLPTRDVRTPDN